MGAAEFAEYKWGHGLGQSLTAYLNQNDHLEAQGVCDQVGAEEKDATDTQGATWQLCKFADGSVVEAGTLAAGVDDPNNEALTQALQN